MEELRAEWVGGPHDGLMVRIPEGAAFIRVHDFHESLFSAPVDLEDVDFRDCVVRQHRGRLSVMWDEAPA